MDETKLRELIADRVEKGAILLDALVPDWERQIDLDRLKMSHCYFCALGQLYGSYKNGIAGLKGDLYPIYYQPEDDFEAEQLGFYATEIIDQWSLWQNDKVYDLLDDAWRELIDGRLTGAEQVQP